MHPYQTLGDINIYSSGIEDVENYKRSLNLEEAVCLVEFDSRSVHFKRENVFVISKGLSGNSFYSR